MEVNLRRNLAPVALAVAIVTLGACGGPMTPGELARSVDTVTSAASEGRLIANDVARDRTKTTFVRARARELGETVDHEAEKLSDATPQAKIAKERLEAIDLAERVGEAVGQIEISPDNSATAIAAARKLDSLAKRGEQLSKGL
jgi:hypothetical protein